FGAEGNLDRRRNLLDDGGGAFLDLAAQRLEGHGACDDMRRQSPALAGQSEQQGLCFDRRRAELASFVSSEEQSSCGLLRVSFEHDSRPASSPTVAARLKPRAPGNRVRLKPDATFDETSGLRR